LGILNETSSRRVFLKNASLITATLAIPGTVFSSAPYMEETENENLVFLFQGDSITDGNRGRNNDPNHIMGHGYAFSIATRVGAHFPTRKLSFINRGISGNKITDLAARWEADTLNLKPDVLSILIGVNDTNAAVNNREAPGSQEFENVFRKLLEDTKRRLPGCRLVVCEPFILPVGRVKENWTAWNSEIKKRQEIANKLASEFETIFVPLQKIFTEAANKPSAEYWIWDGIHPTVAGHELITKEWLKQVGKKLHFLRRNL
jgi:lysophospholipase L1-like esterase